MTVQDYFKGLYDEFGGWFFDKEHPHSKLNKTVFFHDLFKLIGLILVFLIVYSNVYTLNSINIWIIKLGSLFLLVLFIFIIRKAWHLILNLTYVFRGFNHGTKMLIEVAVVLLLLVAFLHQSSVVTSVVSYYEGVEFQKFNPLNLHLNITGFNMTKLALNVNTCPQINVPINFYGYSSFDGNVGTISGTYDGWSIKGSATCRKGSKEGENLNKYYCGGYTYLMGFGSVNAYIQKTDISSNGNIGKTYKYVIWNVYDEDRNFLETKCLGNPDDFDQKQAQALYNEMLRWA